MKKNGNETVGATGRRFKISHVDVKIRHWIFAWGQLFIAVTLFIFSKIF